MVSFIKWGTFDCHEPLLVAAFWAEALGSNADEDGMLERAWVEPAGWQQGDVASGLGQLDLEGLKRCLSEIQAHNAAWEDWFRAHDVDPLVLTYEQVVDDPRAAVGNVAARVSVPLPAAWRPRSPHRKQADEISVAQVAALREALEAEGP